MPADHVHVQTPAVLEPSPPALWPTKAVVTDRTESGVSLDLEGSTLRIVRQLSCGDTHVSRIVVWSRDHDEIGDAETAYEALGTHVDRLQLWSIGAMALGPDWLTPIISEIVASFVHEREEAREQQERTELAARDKAERQKAKENAIDAYLTNKNKRFQLLLQRGSHSSGVFWTIEFKESWERERFWDWLRWQRERFADLAEDLKHTTGFELERRLLREMLATEQVVKKAGLGSGGRRPLRFWRGEI